MKLTPLDIRKQEFKKVMRGYDTVEVDTFLEMLVGEFESVLKEQKDSRERIVELETQLKDYRQIEKTLQQTLLQAQEATGKTYETARREAEVILREAEGRAAGIIEQANSDLIRLNGDLAQLQGRRESVIGRLRVLLNSELEVLKTFEGGEKPSHKPSASPTREALVFEDILKSLDEERSQKTY